MDNKKLNKLVVNYQQTKDDQTFYNIYVIVLRTWTSYKKNVFEHLSKKYGLDDFALQEIGNDVLLECVNEYAINSGDFYNFVRTRLSSRCVDYLRKQIKYKNDLPLAKHFFPYANMEDEAVELIQKKNDQRQLIVSLFGQADLKSRQALTAYSESNSYLEAAKLLGICDKTVERRVRKIGKLFSSDIYGNKYDYFTVPTKAG